MPHSKPQLQIFEPRYRKLYNDILVSGARRFVVASVHPSGDRFAKVGVVLYLTKLKDVSEQTSDEVKYVCDHTVIGRVRIRTILNPSDWEDGSTYLRVETKLVEDDDDSDEDLAQVEEQVMSTLGEVVRLQKELDVAQITPDIAKHINASRAKRGGLWGLVTLWAEYFDYLVSERRAILDEDMQRKYLSYMKEDEGGRLGPDWLGSGPDWWEDDDGDEDDEDMEETEETVFVEDMPPQLQAEMEKMHGQFEDEMYSTLATQVELVQLALQSTSHRERLLLMRDAIANEQRRLAAKLAVRDAVLESRATDLNGDQAGRAGKAED